MNNRLHIGNLPLDTSPETLRHVFAAFGEVTEVQLAMHKDTGFSRGFGFVTMASPEQALAATEGMQGATLGGRLLRVSPAHDGRPGVTRRSQGSV